MHSVRLVKNRTESERDASRMIRTTVFAVLVLAVCFADPLVAGPLDDAKTAFGAGDYATAFALWQPLAEQGNAEAQDNVGRLFLTGRGVPENGPEAVRWLVKAADQGETRSQILLGLIYEAGWGVPEDEAEAARWFAKAALHGDLLAQTHLAGAYYEGRGVPQDFAEAAKWYRKLAELGDTSSQSRLADMYRDGRGVGQNYTEAARLYAEAADDGDDAAQYQLGLLYRDGRGVPQDNVQAHLWLSLAAASPNSVRESGAVRDLLAAGMTQDQIAEATRLLREWRVQKK